MNFPLDSSAPFLDPVLLAQGLGRHAARFHIVQADRLDSTQTALRALAQHPPPTRTCLVARQQLAGQGRRGDAWISDPNDSLTFSLWWVFALPAHELTALGLVTSLAVARALERAGVPDIQLKWPNDLLRKNGKVGGVIAELVPLPNHRNGAIIGIGLNLQAPGSLQSRVDRPIADLVTEQGVPNRATVLGLILSELDDLLETPPLLPDARTNEWMARCCHAQQPVTLRLPDQTHVNGRCLGLAPSGGLLLDHGQDRQATYHGGDISLFQEPA